jgi:hypothetical protein
LFQSGALCASYGFAAMGVVEWKSEPLAPAQAALGVMDAFAALQAGTSADPALGGYRILRPSAAGPTARTRATPTFAMRRHLSVLLAAGFGVAALAGPASCPCAPAGADAAGLAHFAYAKETALVPESAPAVLAAMLIEPASARDTSAISTSAIAPLPPVPRRGSLLTTADGLPAELEPIADAGPPPLRMAAAPLADDPPEALPQVLVQTPPLPNILATDARPEHPAHTSSRRHYRRARHFAAHHRATAPGDNGGGAPVVLRAPSWAQQMYVTPWQSKAFSYTR